MKTITLYSKLVALSLSLLLILQSCVASYQGSYTLTDALNFNRKIKIKTTDSQIVYSDIDTLNGKWIGQKQANNSVVYDTINPESIVKIQLERSKQSESKEGLIILGAIVGAVLIIYGLSQGAKNIKVFGG
ncbi:hypothetical protein U0L90_01245 [Flavobacteriaceae sp. LMIT009]